MSTRLKLADVDRLIDTLYRVRSERGPPGEVETLHKAYVNAKRAEELARAAYGCVTIGLVIFFLAHAFSTGSLRFPDWLIPTQLALISLYLVTAAILPIVFPVLRRKERVAGLLEHFDVDLAPIDGRYARRHMPPSVRAAIEALERAQNPADLGGAYSVVERWSVKAHRLDFDSLYSGFFWCLAVVAAVFGEQFGLPDFWRGAAAASAVLMAFQHLIKRHEEQSFTRRAEDALGRWRHLVPAMRELPQ